MNTVIFACVHNAGRSQMAAAFFNALADPECARAISAGTQPAEHVHPEVVSVMQEAGFDLTHAKPQRLTEDLVRERSSWSRWAAGRHALSCPVWSVRTGACSIRRDSPLTRYGPSATWYANASKRWSERAAGSVVAHHEREAARAVRLHAQRGPKPDGRGAAAQSTRDIASRWSARGWSRRKCIPSRDTC